jgi:hypothetical protein
MTYPTYDTGGYGVGFYGGQSDAWPAPLVEIDITDEPTANIALNDRTWTDVTPYLRGGTWTRAGRTAETQRTQGGNCALTLDNRPAADGSGEPFDKDNPNSPFNVNGGLAWSFVVRISLVYKGVTYRRWTGTKETLAKDRPGFGKDRTATLNGVDLMKALELFPLAGLDLALAPANGRVTDILAAATMQAGTIDSATVSSLLFPEAAFAADDSTSALSHFQSVEQDERGLIFAAGDGGIDFQGRFYRADRVIAGVLGTIGETEGDIRYVGGAPADDNTYLWNVVAVTPPSGNIQVASSASSGDQNYQRRLDMTMLVDDDAAALANGQWYLNRFATPPQRLPQLEILGARDPSTWPTILAANNSDLFTWNGGDSTMSVFLERVSESFSVVPGEPRVRVFWDTSPSVRDYVWKLGVHGASELGVTTRLG